MYTSHLEQDRIYAWVMMIFACILFFALFPLFMLTGFASVLAILIYRGAAFITWRSPRDCVSPLSWLAFEWNYQGLGGQQTGMRVLGLEVAYRGMLR